MMEPEDDLHERPTVGPEAVGPSPPDPHDAPTVAGAAPAAGSGGGAPPPAPPGPSGLNASATAGSQKQTAPLSPGVPRPGADDPVPGWDLYEIGELLGEGGMGRVFRAFDRRLRRHVALKFIRGDDPELLQRFLIEAQAQARVDHPNVLKVFEAGEAKGRPYIAMQLVEGASLSKAARSMSLDEKVRVVRDVAEGLHAAHRIGLIHRDVKPGNILVERTPEGTWHPYVMDFGLARTASEEGMTLSGTALGTPHYMPPEQALGRHREVDRRSDVYALGATLYDLLCSRPPFTGASALEVMDRVLHDEPATPRSLVRTLPVDLETIVLKCLEKDADRRYASARDLADDLARFLSGDPVSAQAPTLSYRVVKKVKKHRAVVAIGALSLAVVLALSGLLLRSRWVSRRQTALAQQLGQDVKEMETLMRFVSYMLPLHDVERERALVRRRMAALEAKVAAAGRIGEGPGRYALGRGYMALARHEDARRELEAAVAAGYRGPEVSVALGETLRWLYDEAVMKMNFLGSRAERDAWKSKAEHELREPAVRHLLDGQSATTVSPAFVKAQVAWLRAQHGPALALAEEASGEVPWLYEALAIGGQSALAIGRELGRKGDAEGAARELDRAEALLVRATEIGRSYPVALRVLCDVHSEAMLVAKIQLRGDDLERRFDRAVRACEAAVTADPLDWNAQLLYSDIHWQLGEHQAARGVDPRPALQKSVSAAERTLGNQQNPAYTLDNIGLAHSIAGDFEARSGRDPVPSYRKASEAFEKAIAGAPGFFSGHNNLGVLQVAWGEWEARQGRDPMPYFEKGMSFLRKANEMRPNGETLSGVAGGHLAEARYRKARGEDVSTLLAAAGQAIEQGLALAPDLPLLLEKRKQLDAFPR